MIIKIYKTFITCGKWSIKGPKEMLNTAVTVNANLIKFVIEKEYQGVWTPSLDDTVKQYALNKYTTYAGAIYRNICLKFNNTANQNAAKTKLLWNKNIYL